MKKLFNVRILITLTILISAFSIGCDQSGKNELVIDNRSGGEESAEQKDRGSIKRLDGKTIRFVSTNNSWGQVAKTLVPEFEKRTGAKINFEYYSDDSLTQKLNIEFSSGSSSIDVFVTRPMAEKRLFSKNKYYEIMDNYINDPSKTPDDWEWKDFFKSNIDFVTDPEGKIYAIPCLTELQLLAYRKDLFENNNLEVPVNFEEMEAAAKKLTDASRGIYGFASRGKGGIAVSQLSTFLFNFGGDYIKNSSAILNTPEAAKALGFYGKMLHDYGPPGSMNMSWPQVQSVFGNGKAAMIVEGSSQLMPYLDASKSKLSNKVGFAVVPAGPAGQHSYVTVPTALAINPKSKQKDEAWELIKWFSSKEVMKYISGKGLTQGRYSIWNDPEVTKDLPGDFTDACKKTLEIGTPYNVPDMTNVGEAREAIGDVIIKSIESGDAADISKLLQKANQKINELLAAAGEGGKK